MKQFYTLSSIMAFFLFVSLPFWGKSQTKQFESGEIVSEYNFPLRPGIPGKVPFWNAYAKSFMYAPAFDFKFIEKATFYRFTAISLATNEEFTFDAKVPYAPLTPIWNKLPVGQVALTIEGLDDKEQIFGLSGTRVFYRAAGYNGPKIKQKMDYNESAVKALAFLYNLMPYQRWLEASLDTSYALNCYPSKIIGAVSESMVLYAKMTSGSVQKKAMTIAKNAADFLISISEPEGNQFEFFPPTYYRDYETLSRGLFTRAKEYQGQLMMSYPATVAGIYLDIFDATGDHKYYDAAIKIANTYVKLQLPSGSWQLKVWMETGEPVALNECIPTSHIIFFDRLEKQYKIPDYKSVRDRAFQWIMQNPVKTFNWEGQFEDIPQVEIYANLSGNWAMEFAVYLFENYRNNQEYIAIAEEILRYAEDQFVVWENPLSKKEYRTETWLLPCVLEQYRYYTPVGTPASIAMTAYQKAYDATGKKIYLEKATELANNLTNVQDTITGQYFTWWDTNPRHRGLGWFNCATSDIKAILEFDKFLK